MESSSPTQFNLTAQEFLTGGGEMGELTRHYNWSDNPLGDTSEWPQSLRTTVSIILNSKFPMFLWWGDQLIQLYNDAYRPSLGNEGKHPAALGQRGADCWPEIWSDIKPLIDRVFTGEYSHWSEDQLLPIYRNGKLEDVYWTFSYSPVKDETGKVGGVLVTCSETTEKVVNFKKTEESEQQFRSMVQQAPLAIGLTRGTDMRFEIVNPPMYELLAKTENIIGKKLKDVLPELEGQAILQIIEEVYRTDKPYKGYAIPAHLTREGKNELRYFNVAYTTVHDESSEPAILHIATDVTEQIVARKKIEAAESRFKSLLTYAPLAVALFIGRDLIIEMPNQEFINMLGGREGIAGKRLVDAMPELVGQPFLQILDDVYTSGIPFQTSATKVNVLLDGVLREGFYNFSYTPLFDENNQVYAILEIAEDVTESTLIKKQLEESESKLRNMILQSPVAMCILKGPDFVVDIANDRILELWGKTMEQVLNKPIFEELPDTKAQGLEALLKSVYHTGKPIKAYGISIDLPRASGIEAVYVDFAYEAFYEANGEISGVMVVASDVTEQVVARQKIEEADASIRNTAERLQLALEAGKLGSYELIIATGAIDCTEQCKKNFGTEDFPSLNHNEFKAMIVPEDRAYAQQALDKAIADHALYHAEYRIIRPDGAKRWIKASGRPVYNEKNEIVKVVGITLDITEHKTFAEELSKQVRERTIELQRSNDDLLQFAHVASHDLKEPARKVKTFTNRLKDEFGELIPEKGIVYLDKAQHATDRMYAMIEGVLNYSTLSSSEQVIEKVDLNEIIKNIETDLEVLIHQKKGIIVKDALPILEGAPVLIYQLFYNLINNSFKFSKPDLTPTIIITSSIVSREGKEMAKIILKDNGIGFETEYTQIIFNAFARLNSKDKYEGTGLGLALCKKIVERHHGSIEAASTKNEGATFTLLIPLQQPITL